MAPLEMELQIFSKVRSGCIYPSNRGDRAAEGNLELRADGRDFGSGDLEG